MRTAANGGSDAAAGTSPATAWATLGKLLGASGIQSGEQAYIGAGIYREVVTVAMTSATVETKLTADVDGAQTGDAGPVIWTAYTTNDKSAPSSSALLTLAGRDFLTFEGFYLQGGTAATNGNVVNASTANSQSITFRRCAFMPALNTPGTYLIRYVGTGGQAANWLIEKCVFGWNNGATVYITLPTVTGADYDANFVVRNCLIYHGAYGLYVDSSGALANKGGGVVLSQSTTWGQYQALVAADTGLSTSIPCLCKNCVLEVMNVGLQATTSGQVVENFNLIHANTARTNVTAGGSSISTYNYAPNWDLGYAALNGFRPRLVLEPLDSASFLGFGNDTSPTPQTDDWYGRPRPAGGASTSNAIGAFERHDTGAKETTTVDSGAASVKITGPGDQDIRIPVALTGNTIAVRVRYDTNHGTTNKPQAILLANGEIGLGTGQTLTATVGVDTWETLTFSAFNASIKGVVTVRLVSRAAAGNGIAYFDTFTVPTVETSGQEVFSRLEPLAVAVGTGGAVPGPRVVQGPSIVAY